MSILNVEKSNVHVLDNFTARFPDNLGTLDQDEEFCWIRHNGVEKKIRFHDYHEVYPIPGFYEFLFYEKLRCNSPKAVCSLLKKQLDLTSTNPESLSVLDVGAGNGMVGEQLIEIGAKKVIGIDIIEEAKEAAFRDRPNLYDAYFVEDLTCLTPETRTVLTEQKLNCLTVVAALGFGDIPPLAFAEAYNLISSPGWLAFNIKERFVSEEDSSGFAHLIQHMTEEGIIEIRDSFRFKHRLSLAGEPLFYEAIVAQKLNDISADWIKAYMEEHEMLS